MAFGAPGWATAARCSLCSINYPPSMEICPVCQGNLSKFSDVKVDSNWREEVENALQWQRERAAESDDPMFVGPSAREHFDATVESLVGVEDFLLECGERLPPPDPEPEAQ